MGPEILIPLLFTGASAVTGIIGAGQQQQQYEAQAALQRQQAQNARTEGALRADDIRRRANVVAGQQAALAGAGGVDVAGSIVDNLANTQANAARDIFNVNWSANARADNLEASANNLDAQGNRAVTNAWIGAGLKTATLLGGSLLKGLDFGASPSISTGTSNSEMLAMGRSRSAGPSAI